MTANEKENFQVRGWIRLPNFLPVEKVIRAREAVLSRLGKEGLWRDGEWHLDELLPSTQPNAGKHLTKGFQHRSEVVDLIGEESHQAVVELLDGHSVFPMAEAQVLFTLPNATIWTIPHHLWHLDLPRLPDCGLPGVQIFTFIDTVVPGGGGTLIVAGSHRLVNESRRVSSQQAKRVLKREPYFRDLMSSEFVDRQRFLEEPGYVGDVELQVVELCGEPGDVFFTDLRLLHTIAPNAAKSPRIMLTQRFLLESLREAIYGGNAAKCPS